MPPYELDLQDRERSEPIGRRHGESEDIEESRGASRRDLDLLEELDEDDLLEEEVDLDARAYGDGPDA